MTDTLLRSLRERLLDESEPLAGLLLACLLLGAETGSESLRKWARSELKELDWRQQITGMRFSLSGPAIAGVLGQIRTQLVDVVADLTADTPLAELPRKDQVDAAVGQRIGTRYNTAIHGISGPTAIGTSASATSEGLSVEDALLLLEAVSTAARSITDKDGQVELLAVLEELRTEAQAPSPDSGTVVKKVGRLTAAAASIGSATLSAAVSGAVEAFTALAMAGPSASQAGIRGHGCFLPAHCACVPTPPGRG
jgi:hypothetical protein